MPKTGKRQSNKRSKGTQRNKDARGKQQRGGMLSGLMDLFSGNSSGGQQQQQNGQRQQQNGQQQQQNGQQQQQQQNGQQSGGKKIRRKPKK